MKNPYILILGVNLESANRGVNALAIGALELLYKNYNIDNFAIFQISNTKFEKEKTITLGNRKINAKLYYFTKKDIFISMIELYLKKIGYTPKSKLSKLILNSYSTVFDVNEGDSFSDIYGYKRIIRHFLDSYLVILSNKELIFLPQTIGPFNTKIGKLLAKKILKKLKLLYIRDGKGIPYLDEWNIPYKMAVDMAVYMKPEIVKNIIISENTIGLNVSGLLYYLDVLNYGNLKSDEFKFYKKLIFRLIDDLIDEGYNVCLIPHTYSLTQSIGEDDLKAIKDILKKKNHEKLFAITDDYNAQQLKYIISKTEFFMGSRMHSCIGALSSSVPTIGLAYSYKFEGTFKIFDMEDYVIDLRNIKEEQDIDNIIDKIKHALKNKEEIKNKLKEINAKRRVIRIEK